jgi:hypothetical protein
MGNRAEGKTMIAARASAELWAGVDEWLRVNPRKSTTDFVLAACLEKLEKEGIPVDVDSVLRDGRARAPEAKPLPGKVRYRKSSSSSPARQAVRDSVDKALDDISKKKGKP